MTGSHTKFRPPTTMRHAASWANRICIVAVFVVFTSSATAQARVETREEVDQILAALEAENCEIIRDAMGEKKLSMKGDAFIVEAKCADGKPYSFTFDQNFQTIDKTAIEY